jgi:glycosyltransferase involved in cell wall biosynthesis
MGDELADTQRRPTHQVRRMPGSRLVNGCLDRWVLNRALEREVGGQRVDVAYCFYEMDIVRALLRVRERHGWPKVVLRMAGMTWAYNVDRRPERASEYERAFSEVDSVNFLHPSLASMVDECLRERGMEVDFRHTFVADVGSAVALALLLIGNGGKRDDAQLLIDRHGVGDRVRIVPALPQEELWGLLSDVDLPCHASESEGLGKMVVEAMRMGLPVLASDVPAINGYLRDGDTGFLVANDPTSWAERIAELRAEPQLRRAVGARARAYADAHFDPLANVVAYEEAFRVVLEG